MGFLSHWTGTTAEYERYTTDKYAEACNWRMIRDENGNPVEDGPAGVRKLDVSIGVRPQANQQHIFPSDAIDGEGYIGWEDDHGYLHGVFRYKADGPVGIFYRSLSIEAWESGKWECVRPVKLWFEVPAE